MMKKTTLAAFVLALAAPCAAAERWIHVHVQEKGDKSETVRVNVPLSLVEQVLPLIRTEPLREGKVRIDSTDFKGTDFRAIWKAVRSGRDAEYVAIESDDERVRVMKSGGFLLVEAEGKGSETEGPGRQSVNVKVPLHVVDALFSSGSEEIDVLAGIRALGAAVEQELVTVEDGSSHVRIWIDSGHPEP